LYYEKDDAFKSSFYGEWLIRWFSGLLDSVLELKRGANTVYLMETDTIDRWVEIKLKDSQIILNVVHAERENGDHLVTTRKLDITSREWGEGESVSWDEFVSEIVKNAEKLIGELLEITSEMASCKCLIDMNNRISKLKSM